MGELTPVSLISTSNNKLYLAGHSNGPNNSPFPQIQLTGYYNQSTGLAGNADATISMFTIGALVNLNEIDKAIDFTIFPDPTDDYLNLLIQNVFYDDNTYVKVFDVLGKEVLLNKIERNNSEFSLTIINVSNLLSGVYLIVIENSKLSISRKFIKQ